MQHHHDAIDHCSNAVDMYTYVREIYTNEAQNIILNGRLLYIQRNKDEQWIPPNLQVEVRSKVQDSDPGLSDVRTGPPEVQAT